MVNLISRKEMIVLLITLTIFTKFKKMYRKIREIGFTENLKNAWTYLAWEIFCRVSLISVFKKIISSYYSEE